nr:M3 family metallopeptidase [Anaerolineae bacterium]
MDKKQTGAENVVWDLTVLYKDLDDPNLQKDMDYYLGQAEAFATDYKGKVGQLDAEELYEALERFEKIYDGSGRLTSFAFLNYSTDTADPKRGALVQKATEFDSMIDQHLLFFMLEWNLLPQDHTQKLMANPVLARFAHHLESERRYKPYQLSEPEERIISEKSVTGNSAWTRFFTQLTSAMRYDFDGQQLNQTQLMTRLYSPDRETRKKAADSMTVGLNAKKMELTYIYNTVIADKASSDKLRGYPTWISSRNLSNKAPDAVVDALINTVTSNYELVARHYRLKRALLGVDELRDYEAKEIILNAFNAFSPNMGEVAGYFFDKNWIHAAVLPNKRGGAYASPVTPSAHPYVFVNFEGRARDVATLAHELGHGIHMYLSGKENGLFGLYTPLTTAEMASVF